MKKVALSLISIAILTFAIIIFVHMNKNGATPDNSDVTSNNIKTAKLPQPEHIVIVVEENHSKTQIIGNKKAPYINELANSGALMTNSHGIWHPSQPNYIALFSGNRQGVEDDSCPHTIKTSNLATELINHKMTFTGYSEDLPYTGFKGCQNKAYRLKHNPWVNFTNVSPKLNKPFTEFPSDYNKLPTVSFVIPNQDRDMHDGTIEQGDAWLKSKIDKYVQWANKNNSLLIVTWDEDDFKKDNLIPTIFVGPMVKRGKYNDYVNHYNILRTIEDMYGLSKLGETKLRSPVRGIWK
ncbi:alkaline phosphatase family protein [Rummeliibacillus stabekisii]|nr:alkaline phosphatase family protein [Rummeliibacillus stabekisii]